MSKKANWFWDWMKSERGHAAIPGGAETEPEPAGATTQDVVTPPAVEGQPQAEGRPDNVWRDHRKLDSFRKGLEAKGYTFDEIEAELKNMPDKTTLEAMRLQQQQQQQPAEPDYAADYSGEEYLSKKDAAKLAAELMQVKKALGDMRNESAADRLEREARETGLQPILQKAYKALRKDNPDADPAQLKAELGNLVQATIQQAKKEQGVSLSPQLNGAQNPTAEAVEEKSYTGSAREQMANWAKDTREALVSRLTGGGGMT